MVEPFFTPEYVKFLEPYIRKTATDLLEKMKARECADGSVDLVEHFALPLPSYVCTYLSNNDSQNGCDLHAVVVVVFT